MQQQTDQTVAQPATARAAYRTPKLVRYGKLASLVQGGTVFSAFESTGEIFSVQL